jgi:hypothetical protein
LKKFFRWSIFLVGCILALFIYLAWKEFDRNNNSGGFISGALRGGLIGGGLAFLWAWAKFSGEEPKDENAKTGTITLSSEYDCLADSGTHFINILGKLSKDPATSTQIISDWWIIEDWLECAGRAFTESDNDKIGKAWRAYFAIGIAPSHELQPVFESFSNQYKSSGKSFVADKPPDKVIEVFDRLIASDVEIQKKRTDDISAEKEKYLKVLRNTQGTNKQAAPKVSWWRKKSSFFRLWAFISVAWTILVLIYIAVFDPFEYGGSEYDDTVYLKVFIIAAIPSAAGLLKFAYDRFVK